MVMKSLRWLPALLLMASLVSAELPDPVEEWSVDLEIGLDVSPIPFPTNNPDSVIVAGGGFVSRISGNGGVLFKTLLGPEQGRGGVFEPDAGDLDGDGNEEIIAGHKHGYVFAVQGETGELMWEFNLGTPLDTWEMARVADLDGDGTLEVLCCNLNGWIFCLNHDGTLRWRSRVENYRPSTPAIGDINNDGRPEIVFGTATRHIIALDAEGRLVWDAFHPPLHLGRTMPLIADLDADGNAEIYSMSSMISPDTGLIALNGKDGSLRWVAPTYHKAYMGRGLVRFSDGTMGVLACDKGNNVCAYDVNGKERWHIRLEIGDGIWTPPVVADIDGNGTDEIVIGTRRKPWAILNADDGTLLKSMPTQSGSFGGRCIADIDQDGTLEVIHTEARNIVQCYSFGGAANAGAILSGDWRGVAHPRSIGEVHEQQDETVATLSELTSQREIYFGDNPFPVEEIPQQADALEISTVFPDGIRHSVLFRLETDRDSFQPEWPAYIPGYHRIQIRWWDTQRGHIVQEAAGTADVGTLDSEGCIFSAIIPEEPPPLIEEFNGHPQLEAIEEFFEGRYEIRLETFFESIAALDEAGMEEKDRLVDEVKAYRNVFYPLYLQLCLVAAELKQDNLSRFVFWQDDNPWDNVDPAATLPLTPGVPVLNAWAFQNETESVCVNFMNMTLDPMLLRLEPGTVMKDGEAIKGMKPEDIATLFRPVWLPSVYDEVVPDVFPPLAAGQLIELAPLQAQQLWINLSTHALEGGVYELTWPVRTLDAQATTETLTVRLEVSPVRLPEDPGFYACFWSKNELHGEKTTDDLNEHLQTIWYGIPLPAAKADAQGNLVGEIDWTAHDAPLQGAKRVKRILYGGGVRVPTFPEGVEVTEEIKLNGQRAYFQALLDHLAGFGLDHTNIMFYVEDETGLKGTHEHYMERAKANKAVDPRVQNYANPWGGITVAMIRDMEPYTDFWQPGMETIEYLGQEYVDAMRGPDHKPIATYTPPGNCRILRPLGFFRAQAWQAYHWGIEGGGWWVYHGTNIWATGAYGEPDYGAVYHDGRERIGTRRWEANRDGIEDFAALHLLKDAAEEANDAEAMQVIDAAVSYVANRTITGMPREAAEYDLDYAVFMEHRSTIRAALERLHQ